MQSNLYRPEIDGLRALAVLSVVIFHAGVDFLAGGFVGVDIFYVISGFLISRILLNSLAEGSFSYADFYSRRIKRLLPAALVMICFTLIFGAFILSPNKYVELAKSAAFSNLFMANIWFMKNSGYFDLSTQISPLVHMWSLSIEEQFYLIYPAFLIYCYKRNKIKGIKIGVTLLFVSSLLLSITLSNKSPDFAFYMLPTRAWELALGALVALFFQHSLTKNWQINGLSIIALALIIYSLTAINHNDVYPGYLAILPTFAAAIILIALNQNCNLLAKLLSSKPVVFIGKISYSVYLWHWPIVVYYRIYINERSFTLLETIGLIIVSLIIGALSWKLVEEKFRYQKLTIKSTYTKALMATLAAISLSCFIYFTQGFAARVDSSLSAISNNKVMWQWSCTQTKRIFAEIDDSFCVIGKPWDQAKTKGIVWGDSHSQHWAQILHYQAINNDMSLIIAPRKCPAFLNKEFVRSHYPKYPNFTQSCSQRNQLTLNWLKNNDDVEKVILASAWSGHVRMLYTEKERTNYSNQSLEEKSAAIGSNLSLAAFEHLLTQLKTKKVLLLADIPRPNKILNECAFSESASLLRQKCDENDYKQLNSQKIIAWHYHSNQLLKQLALKFDYVTSIIPTDFLCDSTTCQTYINDELIYKDENHIRRNLKSDSVQMLADKLGFAQFFNN